jgi:hypothetical protein
MLSRVGYLSHVLSRLVAGHKFYIHNTYIVRDVVHKNVGKPPSFLDVSYRVRRGTRSTPPELGIYGRGRRMTHI